MPNNFRGLRKLVGVFISLGFLGWCLFFFKRNPDVLVTFFHIHFQYIWILATMQIIFYACNGRIVREMLRKKGLAISEKESFFLSIVASAVNNFMPLSSGVVFRTYYLKRYHHFSLTHSFSLLIGFYVLAYWIACWCGIISCYRLFHEGYGEILWVGGLFFCGVLGCSAILFFPKKLPAMMGRWGLRLEGLLSGTQMFAFHPGGRMLLFLYGMINQTLIALMLAMALYATGVSIAWDHALFLSSAQFLTLLLPLTPGNIGVTEGILAIGAKMIGIPVANIVLASLVLRGTALVVLFILSPFALYGLFHKDWRAAFRKTSK